MATYLNTCFDCSMFDNLCKMQALYILDMNNLAPNTICLCDVINTIGCVQDTVQPLFSWIGECKHCL